MEPAAEPSQGTVRITRIQRVLEGYVFNPLFRWLLRSRLHWLVSRRLLLVSYTGRRTGRRYRFPVLYSRRGASLTVITPKRESEWWKNFTEPMVCQIWYRGVERPATGELITGTDRRVLLRDYIEAHGVVNRLWGISNGKRVHQNHGTGLVVVRFRID